MAENEDLLLVASRVDKILKSLGIDAVVIGAIAMAAHRHIRFTEDLDLGVNA